MTERLADVDTPSLLVEQERLLANITSYAELATVAGVRIRPHVKTHKTVEIAKLQKEAGASGITVAKPSEAEVYVNAGFDDVFVAYPVVGPAKWRRLAALARRARLIVGADSPVGVEGLAEAAKDAGSTIEVRVELDSGLHRSGLALEQLGELCAQVMRCPSLELEGIFTFRSTSFSGALDRPVPLLGQEEGELLADAALQLRKAGFPIQSASGGSTPTARAVAAVEGVTEIRPGTYVFHDLMTRADGACTLDDLALSVLGTVVSRPAWDVAVVDAGSKTLAGDVEAGVIGLAGYGVLAEGGGCVAWLNEEHGVVQLTESFQPRVGSRLKIYPVHVCTVVNLAQELVVVGGDQVLNRYPIVARACSQ